jgi:uncharacterized Zn-finger protein
MPTYEEKTWSRFLGYLTARPLAAWKVRGWLGEPEIYGRSLYRLQMALPTGSWWSFEGGVGQQKVPTPLLLSPDRCIEGGVLDLRDVTCHPERAALVRVMDMLKHRIAARFPQRDDQGFPHVAGVIIGRQVFIDCPYCGMVHTHGVGSHSKPGDSCGHRVSHCHIRIPGDRGYFIEHWVMAPDDVKASYRARFDKQWRWRSGS